VSGAENKDPSKWTLGIRALSNQIPRASLRTTLTYRVHPRLSIGVEYNPRADDVGVLANLVAITEKASLDSGHKFRPHRHSQREVVLRNGQQEPV